MHTEMFYFYKPEAKEKKILFLCSRKSITLIEFYVCVCLEVQSFT